MGLATIYYCTVIIVIAAIMASVGNDDIPVISLLFLVIGGMVVFGAGIGVLVGEVMCLSVPEASGAKGFIIGVVICIAVNLGLSIFGAFIPALGSLGSLVSLVGYVLFILFIRQSAIYLGDQKLADSAFQFLVFAVVVFVGAIALGVFAAIGLKEIVLGLLVLFAVVCGIVYLVWYLKLIRSLMTTIEHRTGQ